MSVAHDEPAAAAHEKKLGERARNKHLRFASQYLGDCLFIATTTTTEAYTQAGAICPLSLYLWRQEAVAALIVGQQ